jgi:ABC-type nickel/cobalt efflux system permease component RcnA
MKFIDAISDMENRIAANTKPWMRIVGAILLITFMGVLLWKVFASPSAIEKRNTKASTQFGEALLKNGIQTQATPGK